MLSLTISHPTNLMNYEHENLVHMCHCSIENWDNCCSIGDMRFYYILSGQKTWLPPLSCKYERVTSTYHVNSMGWSLRGCVRYNQWSIYPHIYSYLSAHFVASKFCTRFGQCLFLTPWFLFIDNFLNLCHSRRYC